MKVGFEKIIFHQKVIHTSLSLFEFLKHNLIVKCLMFLLIFGTLELFALQPVACVT